MGLSDRLIPDPASLEIPALLRGLRWAPLPYQLRCMSWLGERGAGREVLRERLRSKLPALRRASARALGVMGGEEKALEEAFFEETTEEGLSTIALSLFRSGVPKEELIPRLDAFHRRQFKGISGWVEPGAAARRSSPSERLLLAMGNREVLRKKRIEKLNQGDGAVDLAVLQHPDDFLKIRALLSSSGRRAEHRIHLALGYLGDPRSATIFRDLLYATDVDPGRGFTQRRLAAEGLGRLGLPSATPWILDALQQEARDFEGRPGAGMGIQYPVRTDLLEALGELQDPKAIPVLLTYLGNTHGSAFGGFYFAAMDALSRYGRSICGELRRVAERGPEVEAAHAVGVLRALGESVERYREDPRRSVALVAGP